MSFHLSHIFVISLLFLFIIFSGFILKKAGDPRPVLLLTLHKLLSIATVVLLVLVIVKMNRTARLDSVTWISITFTTLFFLIAIISGGMLSMPKTVPPIISLIHRLTSVLALLGASAIEYKLYSSL